MGLNSAPRMRTLSVSRVPVARLTKHTLSTTTELTELGLIQSSAPYSSVMTSDSVGLVSQYSVLSSAVRLQLMKQRSDPSGRCLLGEGSLSLGLALEALAGLGLGLGLKVIN